MSQTPIQVGQPAPDFQAKDQNGNVITLSELKGKKVLLSFHPLAWTGVCMNQMQALELAWDRFQALNTLPIGVSIDSVPCKKAWAESMLVTKLPMIADFWPHGQIASNLGIFRDADGFSERANILINEEGVVEWIKVYPIKELPDIEVILAHLKAHA